MTVVMCHTFEKGFADGRIGRSRSRFLSPLFAGILGVVAVENVRRRGRTRFSSTAGRGAGTGVWRRAESFVNCIFKSIAQLNNNKRERR